MPVEQVGVHLIDLGEVNVGQEVDIRRLGLKALGVPL